MNQKRTQVFSFIYVNTDQTNINKNSVNLIKLLYLRDHYYFEINNYKSSKLYEDTWALSQICNENILTYQAFCHKNDNCVFISDYCNVSNNNRKIK